VVLQGEEGGKAKGVEAGYKVEVESEVEVKFVRRPTLYGCLRGDTLLLITTFTLRDRGPAVVKSRVIFICAFMLEKKEIKRKR